MSTLCHYSIIISRGANLPKAERGKIVQSEEFVLKEENSQLQATGAKPQSLGEKLFGGLKFCNEK